MLGGAGYTVSMVGAYKFIYFIYLLSNLSKYGRGGTKRLGLHEGASPKGKKKNTHTYVYLTKLQQQNNTYTRHTTHLYTH